MKQAIAALALFSAAFMSSPASATNCVAYVKTVTGFSLMGDAWQWWGAANHVYERGYVPAPGAVMVFSRTGHMHVGHVAVVRQILGPREILIDQANWHHGRVDRGVSIHDLSPANDWSSVEVEWTKGVYGGPFPITGFVYAPGAVPAEARGPLVERNQPRLIEATAYGQHAHLVLASNRALPGQHVSFQTASLAPAAAHVPAHAISRRPVAVVSKAPGKTAVSKASKPSVVKAAAKTSAR